MSAPTGPDRPRWPMPVVGGKYVRHLDRPLRALRGRGIDLGPRQARRDSRLALALSPHH
jgi:hypothetical protein